VPSPVFLARAYINEGYVARSHAPKKLFAANWFHLAALLEKVPRNVFDFREPGFGQPA
jgi:hypothetical protein